ncbi:MAG: rod-binding protein [Clostridiales bacterium]|jgi:flagellar protein FlgJ|nr:rod-binding protein [Clostridiales bacterium]
MNSIVGGAGISMFQDAFNAAESFGNRNPEDIKKAGEEIEGYFVHALLKEMRRTVPESSLFPKSHADRVFQDMFDEQIAQNIARAGGVGIAKAFERLY